MHYIRSITLILCAFMTVLVMMPASSHAFSVRSAVSSGLDVLPSQAKLRQIDRTAEAAKRAQTRALDAAKETVEEITKNMDKALGTTYNVLDSVTRAKEMARKAREQAPKVPTLPRAAPKGAVKAAERAKIASDKIREAAYKIESGLIGVELKIKGVKTKIEKWHAAVQYIPKQLDEISAELTQATEDLRVALNAEIKAAAEHVAAKLKEKIAKQKLDKAEKAAKEPGGNPSEEKQEVREARADLGKATQDKYIAHQEHTGAATKRAEMQERVDKVTEKAEEVMAKLTKHKKAVEEKINKMLNNLNAAAIASISGKQQKKKESGKPSFSERLNTFKNSDNGDGDNPLSGFVDQIKQGMS